MKRKHERDSKNKARTGDIKKDLSTQQLAALGAAALAYNEVERNIELLFFIVSEIPGPMQYEVSTRISGIDAKKDIVLAGAKYLKLEEQDRAQLGEALGEGIFSKLKQYRNAAVHSRIIDASVGIGLSIESKARLQEVLLTVSALDALYENLVALAKELNWFANLIGLLSHLNKHSVTASRESSERALATWTERVRALRSERKSLPPIPEFPPEHELDAAEIQWLQAQQSAQMGWFSQWPAHFPRQMSAALHDAMNRPAGPIPEPLGGWAKPAGE